MKKILFGLLFVLVFSFGLVSAEDCDTVIKEFKESYGMSNEKFDYNEDGIVDLADWAYFGMNKDSLCTETKEQESKPKPSIVKKTSGKSYRYDDNGVLSYHNCGGVVEYKGKIFSIKATGENWFNFDKYSIYANPQACIYGVWSK